MSKSRQSSSFFRAGLPLIALTVGGWVGLSAFMQARFDVKDARTRVVDMGAPIEKQRAKKFSIEEEVERLKNSVIESNYKNKPIDRPKDW